MHLPQPLVLWVLIVPFALFSALRENLSAGELPAARAKRQYLAARELWKQNPDDARTAWQFARTAYDWAEFATKDNDRAAIAEEGIAASRSALLKESTNVAPHFYLVMNLGQLAKTKSVGALKLVEEMEKELKTCLTLDPKFDNASPHRTLALLYAEAPGWPISVGDRSKAEQHFLKAVELRPEYPGNQIALLEFYVSAGKRSQAKTQLEVTNKMLPAARQEFRGDEWETSWVEWDERMIKVKRKLSGE